MYQIGTLKEDVKGKGHYTLVSAEGPYVESYDSFDLQVEGEE